DRNGKKVSLDNVKRDGNKVKIVGDHDDVVFEFTMNDDGTSISSSPGKRTVFRALGQPQGQGPGGADAFASVTMEPPKAMIGVQLGDVDGMLLGHFGLKPGQATLVTGVYN